MERFRRITLSLCLFAAVSAASSGCDHGPDDARGGDDDAREHGRGEDEHTLKKDRKDHNHKRKRPTVIFPTLPSKERSPLADFVLIAETSVAIDDSASVTGGDVGARAVTPGFVELSVGAHSRIQKQLFGDSVELRDQVNVGDIFTNKLTKFGNVVHGQLFDFKIPPRLPPVVVSTPGTQSISVHQHDPLTLTPGKYLDIRVKTKGSLTLEGGTYELRTLRLDNFATLTTKDFVSLRVQGRVSVAKEATIGPAPGGRAGDLRINVNAEASTCSAHGDHRDYDEHDDDHGHGHSDDDHDCGCDRDDDDDGDAVELGPGAQLRAVLSTLDGEVDIERDAKVFGAISGKEIEVGDRAQIVLEDGFACRPATCSFLALTCGVYPDGCGGVINCGPCSAPQQSCFGLSLVAAETHDPELVFDGIETLSTPIEFAVPAALEITQGEVTLDGAASLSFALEEEEPIHCSYIGQPAVAASSLTPAQRARYVFDGCTSAVNAGGIVTADTFALHLTQPGASPTTIMTYLVAEPCNCTPATCDSLAATCGVLTDGCSGVISCGSCAGGEICGGDPARPLACGCQAKSCEGAGAECGLVDGGCGGNPSDTLFCGDCDALTTCGGGGTANRCGCTPFATCGEVVLARCDPDRGTLAQCEAELLLKDFSVCDSLVAELDACLAEHPEELCTAQQASLAQCRVNAPPLHDPSYCNPSRFALAQCEAAAQQSAAQLTCGMMSDGCGGNVVCGTCDSPQTCGGGGIENACGCTPASCADFGRACGVITDGCGGLKNCGGCAAPQACDIEAGQCVAPTLYTNSSASLATPASVPDGQGFTITIDASVAGQSVDTSVGPGIAVGPAVTFLPEAFSRYVFSECADATIPFDPTLVAANPPATVDDLQVFLVTETPAGATLLVPQPTKRVDTVNRTLTICTLHLSTYIVVLRTYCTAKIESETISVISGVQSPARAGWSISLERTGEADASVFTPPPVLQLSASHDSNACVGVYLFYGDVADCPSAPDNLCHVCIYDNSIFRARACEYPFNQHAAACGNVRDPFGQGLGQRRCYNVEYTDSAMHPPAHLGNLASFVATVGDKAAWVDPLSETAGVARARFYNLSVWIIPGRPAPSADVTNIVAKIEPPSHPHICVTSTNPLLGGGSVCGEVSNGCGGTMHCAACPPGQLCGDGSNGRTKNVCYCVNPGCGADGPPCGSVLIDISNPCVVGTCVDAAQSVIRYDPQPDRTPCSDLDECNGLEQCFGGVCVGGVGVIRDDGDPCTDDACSASTGVASHLRTLCAPQACVPASEGAALRSGAELTAQHQAKAAAAINALKQECASCAQVLP
ncbi:MAG: hypothetical protein IT381_24725 [Deltaproteobacteria bacterium]|nr:hypothetical protein [Deltaproteobacteria bacterium]